MVNYTFKYRNNSSTNKVNKYVSFLESDQKVEHDSDELEKLIPYLFLDYLPLNRFDFKFHQITKK